MIHPSFAQHVSRLRQFMSQSLAGAAAGSAVTHPKLSASFGVLALELFRLQHEFNPVYRTQCQARGMAPDRVSSWAEIPALPVRAFKEFEVTCLPAADRTTVFHSSGTTGHEPSRHSHSAESLAIYEASLWPWFRAHVLPEPEGNFGLLILTPPPAEAPHSSLAHMFGTIQRELRTPEAAFVGRADETGAWALDWRRVEAAMETAAGDGRPMVVLGTAFSFVHLVDWLAAEGLRWRLPAGSRVLETGGYKGRSRELPQAELHQRITDYLGIAPAGVRREYGMSELSSQAYDGVAGLEPDRAAPVRVFTFPPWARARVVSPETGQEVSVGETGLIQVFDLANVFSVMALQTEDLGLRREDGFELLGRARMAEGRGCSLLAS